MKKTIYYVLVALMLFTVNTNLFALTNYVLNGHNEVIAFAAGGSGTKEAIGTLTVYGQDVTQADFNTIADRVLSCGTVTFENFTNGTGWEDANSVGDIGPFFLNVTCNGGIIFRNCPYMTWPNGFNKDGFMIRHIYGDFIIDNCSLAWSGVDGWAADLFYSGLEEVDGDFIITNYHGKFNLTSGQSLTKVGGNFEISNPNPTDGNVIWSWELGFINLKEVGGDFTIDCTTRPDVHYETLTPLASLESVGGNVKIVNMNNIQISGQGATPYGYCYARYLIDAGIINYAEKTVQLGFTDALIDLATLGGCSDGITPEAPPAPLPVTALNGPKEATSKISLTDRTLNIESKDALKKVELFDLSGKSLLQFFNVEAGVTPLNVSQLKKGVYIVKLSTVNYDVSVHKIVK